MSGKSLDARMAKRFNLDAARREAAAREAALEPFVFEFGTRLVTGEGGDVTEEPDEFVIPPTRQWPIEVSSQLATGRVDVALENLLGEADYERFLTHGPVIGDLDLIFEEAGKWSGVGDDGPKPSPTPRGRASTRT